MAWPTRSGSHCRHGRCYTRRANRHTLGRVEWGCQQIIMGARGGWHGPLHQRASPVMGR